MDLSITPFLRSRWSRELLRWLFLHSRHHLAFVFVVSPMDIHELRQIELGILHDLCFPYVHVLQREDRYTASDVTG